MIKLLLLMGALAFAQSEAEVLGPPADAPRDEVATAEMTIEVAQKLRCPVCQGLSVNDSKADAAVAMRARIEELVAAGYSEDQIVDFFVERYGEFVLLEPRREGLNWVVWLGPVIFLAGGGGWLLYRWTGSAADTLTPAPASAGAPGDSAGAGDGAVKGAGDDSEDDYVRRILAELGEGGGEGSG